MAGDMGKLKLGRDRQIRGQAARASSGRRLRRVVPFVLLVVLASVAYVNAGPGELFFDSTIMADRLRTQDVASSLRAFWQTLLRPGEEFTYVTFAINRAAGRALGVADSDATGFLVVNTLIHALNGCLLYLLLRALLRVVEPEGPPRTALPLVLAAIFAVHPLNAASVAYIMQRRGMLAVTFYLAGLLGYLRFRGARQPWSRITLLAAVIVCYWLSFKSKSMGLTLPLAIMALEFCVCAAHRQALKRFLAWAIPGALLCTVGMFAYLRSQRLFEVENFRILAMSEKPLWGPWPHFLTESRVFWHYWKLIFLPLPSWLCINHDFNVSDQLSQHGAWAAVLLHGALIGATVVAAMKRYTIGAFGVLLFYIALIPWAVLPQRELFVEYKTYLSLIGAILVVAEIVRRLPANAVIPVSVLIAAVLLVSTLRRNAVYQNEYSVWADAVQKYPGNARAHTNLGIALRARGKTDEAIEQYREALRIDPDSPQAHICLANALRVQGKLDQAVEEYRRAVSVAPDNSDAHLMLGTAYYEQGKLDDAIRHYRLALQVASPPAHTHYCLGLALEKQGKLDEAISEYSAALAIEPGHADARKALEAARRKAESPSEPAS
jgi:tetratricopeptide (TPR) repeat protein